MEATAVSVGKAVLSGAVDYAKSTVAGEIALQLGVERDVGFIADEMEMMQSFLMTADEERDQSNKVLNTWVKQVRNVAYNVEDSLVDFEVLVEREKPPLLGCIPRNPCDRRRIAMEVKELRSKVEDISNRNLRYRLIKDGAGGSKAADPGVQQGGFTGAATILGIDDEVWRATMEQEKPDVDLGQLILSKMVDLQVIAVWGRSGDFGKTSVISKVFDDTRVKAQFKRRAWVGLMHPFDPKEFLRSLLWQFYVNSSQETEISIAQEGKTVGTNILLKMGKLIGQSDLVHEYDTQVSNNKYLIVVDGLSKVDEWHSIKSYLPDKKNGSRIIVATQQVEIASLCPEQPCQASKMEQLSSNQVLYLFHKKKPETDSETATGPSRSSVTPSEIQEENVQQLNDAGGENVVSSTLTIERNFYRSKTRAVNSEDIVVGRTTEKQTIIDLVGRPEHSPSYKVITVWGMGGIGKTTLVRSVYRSQQLSGWKHAWVTVFRPFNRDTLLRKLALQLQDLTSAGEKRIIAMEYTELVSELLRFLKNQNCLIVLDDLSSVEEWNSVKTILAKSRRIIATTREKFVAEHCSKDDQNMYSLGGLEEAAALDLFKRKVFKDASNFGLDLGMLDLAKLILKQCHGLPLAIATIGGYLANRPHSSMEWRKLNSSLSAEIEINLELKMINTTLMRSYDGLPYHLKACFLYLAIFPEDHIIRRAQIVKRWMAEGFSREMQHMTAVQVGNKYFDELIDRSMTLSCEEGTYGEIDSCQLHDLIREICVAKAREENHVFTLEEGCSMGGIHGAIRHLVISSNWIRDKDVIQSMLDLSHIRSLTVFGEWRSFLISSNTRYLRVLDLEHTVGLRDHHLDQIMELLHLRYLSLRGCVNIFKLPDSMANLRHLQTLDVRSTYLRMLPVTITSLQKLQYIYTSGRIGRQERHILYVYQQLMDRKYSYVVKTRSDETTDMTLQEFLQWSDRRPRLERHWNSCMRRAKGLRNMCHLFWRPRWLEDPLGRTAHAAEGVTRHDICNMCCYLIKHKKDTVVSGGVVRGIEVLIGISKMKALHTLRDVSVACGKATFQELRELTQLRKLGVTDVTEENNEKFWRAIAGHSKLQSLSVSMVPKGGRIDYCLGETLGPPKCLESLKISGEVVKLTEWILRLQNLTKLQLEKTSPDQDAIHAIGKLPNLEILRLNSYPVGVQFHAQCSSFRSLSVLQLYSIAESLEFGQEAMPKLELLQISGCFWLEEISGLQFLASLKEIRVDDIVNELVQRKLAEYPNNITLKLM